MCETSEIIFGAEEEEEENGFNYRALSDGSPPTNTSLRPDIAVGVAEPRPSVI